jgi:aminopeptidase-like protein
MFWLLNFSDGTHSLLGIAEQAGLRFDMVQEVAQMLGEHGLLKSCT